VKRVYQNPRQLIDFLNRVPLPRGFSRRDFVRVLITAFGLPVLIRLEREARATTTYFGYDHIGGTEYAEGAATYYRNTLYTVGIYSFQCPGTGKWIITELSAACKSGNGNPRIGLLGIFSTTRALIAQGSTAFSITSMSFGWHGHGPVMDNVLNPSAPQIDGGTNYILALAGSSLLYIASDAGDSGDYNYGYADYTSGFPDPIPVGVANTSRFSIRCGVEPLMIPSRNLTLLGVGR